MITTPQSSRAVQQNQIQTLDEFLRSLIHPVLLLLQFLFLLILFLDQSIVFPHLQHLVFPPSILSILLLLFILVDLYILFISILLLPIVPPGGRRNLPVTPLQHISTSELNPLSGFFIMLLNCFRLPGRSLTKDNKFRNLEIKFQVFLQILQIYLILDSGDIHLKTLKRIESLSQIRIFESLYLCNLML